MDGGQVRVELGRPLELRNGLARVGAPHVLQAQEEVPLGALPAPEETVDHGLAPLQLLAPEEGVAEEVGEEAVVPELRLERREQLDHPGVVAQLELAVGEQEEGRALGGVALQHLLELRGRLLGVAGLVEGEAQVEADPHLAGVGLERLAVVPDRVLEAAEAGQGGAEVGARVQAPGDELERLLVGVDRPDDVARLVEGDPLGEGLVRARHLVLDRGRRHLRGGGGGRPAGERQQGGGERRGEEGASEGA